MRPDSTLQWRAYPALLLAGCVALGIVAAAGLPRVGLPAWIVLGLASVAAAGAAARAGRGRLVSPARIGLTLAAALAAFAAGGARQAGQRLLPPHHVARFAGAAVVLEGRVADEPAMRPYGLRFVVAAARVAAGTDPVATVGRVQVTLRQRDGAPPLPPLAYGDAVVLVGTLRPVPRPRNPADFDYGAYLMRRGTFATLSVAGDGVVVRARAPCVRFGCRVAAARVHVRARLARLVPGEAARAVLAALLLGDRSGLDDATLDRFARTGLMHLLAVSGLHVLLVGMVLYGLLRPGLLRLGLSWRAMEAWRTGLTLALLLGYLVLTGGSAPVVRAVVMAALLMFGALLQRSAPTLNTLGVAALVLLLVRPSHVFEAGFQLSFAAVGAIVTINPVLLRHVPEAWRRHPAASYVLGLVTVSMAATLGTTPVLLYHFGAVSLAGLVLNVVAIPITFLTLAAGLATVATGGMTDVAAEAFGAAADVLARALLATATAGDATLSWAAIHTRVDNLWFVAALAAVLLLPVQWPRPRYRWRLVAAALFFASAGVWAGVLVGRHRPVLDVLFFDVGQGDAALVTLPNGRRLLVDAGLRDDRTDTGARTLLPHVARYGIDAIDAVVVTHPHSDHLGGVPSLLRAVPVGRFLHNGKPYDSALYRETIVVLDSLAVPHRALRAGDTLALDPSVRIHVLAPEDEALPRDGTNDASVVLRLAFGETVVLFTGDLEAEGEARLVATYGRLLPGHVVKVAHHGSRTSSTEAFVAHAAPSPTAAPLAVVSVAAVNRYGLPNEDVLARWHHRGAALHLTSHAGALWLRSDGRRLHRVDWRRPGATGGR